MAPSKSFTVVLLVYGFFHCILVSGEENQNVIFRLSFVENAVSTLRLDNVELRFENDRLRADNEDLLKHLAKYEAKFDSKINEFETKQQRLVKDNNEFRNAITKLERSLTIKDKELEETKRRLRDTEAEMTYFKVKLSELDQVPGQQKKGKHIENEGFLKENIRDFKHASWKNVPGSIQPRQKIQHTNRIREVDDLRLDFPKFILKSYVGSSRPTHKRLLDGVSVSQARSKISFSAHMTAPMTNLGNNQPFVFDRVNNNEGGAYDARTGVFSCPVTGTYFFTAHIFSHPGDAIWGEIVVNSVTKARLDANANGTTANAAASNSLIIQCNTGDDVWIRHMGGYGTQVYGRAYSHFAGFLLWAA